MGKCFEFDCKLFGRMSECQKLSDPYNTFTCGECKYYQVSKCLICKTPLKHTIFPFIPLTINECIKLHENKKGEPV